jgi:hypothetical protein
MEQNFLLGSKQGAALGKTLAGASIPDINEAGKDFVFRILVLFFKHFLKVQVFSHLSLDFDFLVDSLFFLNFLCFS